MSVHANLEPPGMEAGDKEQGKEDRNSWLSKNKEQGKGVELLQDSFPVC